MKITIEHEGSTITIEREELNLNGVIENIIKPALIATGYAESTVDIALGGDDV